MLFRSSLRARPAHFIRVCDFPGEVRLTPVAFAPAPEGATRFRIC